MTEIKAGAERHQQIGAVIIGIALAGFFDGILLHQVLQWHHLLSLVEGESLQDIRTQILADGLFHVLMYVLAGIGLWLLWRGRTAEARSSADRALLAGFFLGFGAWQFLDVILFHWIVGIHRIRVDVPNPLAWDIGWVVLFGVPTVAVGLWLLAKARKGPPSERRSSGTVPGALAGLVLIAGPVSLVAPQTSTTIVLFRPGATPAETFAAVAANGGKVVWAHESGEMLAVDMPSELDRLRLYGSGAIYVGVTGIVGCTAWFRV